MKRKILLICVLTLLVVLSAVALTSCSEVDRGNMTPTVAIINPTKTYDSINFEILENDPTNVGKIVKIELIKGEDTPVEAESTDIREFDGLLSNTEYTVRVTYEYAVTDDEGELQSEKLVKALKITTEAKETPSATIINISKTDSKIGFEILESDKDNVGQIIKIELLHGYDAPIVLTDLTKREFTGLLSDSKYTLRVTYKYDLNDGTGEKTVMSTADIYTEKAEYGSPSVFVINPVSTTDSIAFEILEIDKGNVGHIERIELLRNDQIIEVNTNASDLEFTGLYSDNLYTVRVVYNYDLNDGTGEKTLTATLDIKTEREKAPEIYFIAALGDKTSVYFDILELDNGNIGEIAEIRLYKDGGLIDTSYNPYLREFTGLDGDSIYTVKVIYEYDFGNGNGVHTQEISIDIPTIATYPPVVFLESDGSDDTSVSFILEVIDLDDIGYEIDRIQLFKRNGVLVRTATDITAREFTELDPGTAYTVSVTYSYDLNDGNGKVTETVTVDISTTGVNTVNNWSSKTHVLTNWSGRTLNVACSTWSSHPGAPWSVMELCIDYGKTSGFGTIIDNAILDREQMIKETYGVKLNWINATRWAMQDALETATISGNVNYDLAMPRGMNAQAIVSGGFVYDMANREYINFDQSYYDQNSVEAYTAKHHTFFVTGDFTTLHKETASVLYFDKDLLGGSDATEELYDTVRNGQWTWDELLTLTNGKYKDDGDGIRGDTDSYGLSLTSLDKLYEFFGVKQVGVDKSTRSFVLTLNDTRVNGVIDAIIEAKTGIWCRTTWGGSYGANAKTAFTGGRVLFYNEVLQNSDVGEYGGVGVVPFPKLDAFQESYYAPCSIQQTVLMCIPKITQDRNMSDYFLDVLSWTGKSYTARAYLQDKSNDFESDVEIEMIRDYIIPNIIYDIGTAVKWGSVMNDARTESYAGNVNDFAYAYNKYESDALQTINTWNAYWGAYTDA